MLLSVNVGMPKDVSWHGKTVYTGVWKDPVAGPQMVRRLNIDGDGQGDTKATAASSGPCSSTRSSPTSTGGSTSGATTWRYGNFGENLTVDGLPDDEVCIGDRYRIGEAEFEVTQPRVTCYRVGMRLGEPELPALLVSHHRPGFYMRVITEGRIQAGDPIVKTTTGPGALSVADTDALLYLPGRDRAKLRVAAAIPALSPGWQGSFRDLLAGPQDGGTASAGGTEPAPPAWPAFRKLRVTKVVRESENVSLVLPHGRRRRRAPGGPRGPVPHAAGDRRRAAGPGPQLLAVVGPRRRHLPDQRQAGAPRRRERLPEPAACGRERSWTWPRPAVTSPSATSTGPVLLISAGIGVTPVLSMLHQLAARAQPAGSLVAVRGTRTARAPLRGARRTPCSPRCRNAREHVFYSAATPAERRRAHAAAGHLTKEALAGLGIPAGASAYICGPASFMADMQDALTAIGLGQAAIHTELFGALPSINPGITGQARQAPHQPPGPPGPRPARHLRPQRHHRAIRRRLAQRARPRRRL